MTIYKDYASVYDASGQTAFSEQMIPYLQRVLTQHRAPGPVMVDLACGTGTVALAMARAGWQVTGIDGSEGMLAQARAKQASMARLLENPVAWQLGDMRSFTTDHAADLVTCLYDSLNYMLTSEDLLAVFRCVAHALAPGGLFLCDMNTAYALETFWDDDTYVQETPDLTVIMASQHDYARHRSIVTVTCFERLNELYRKIQEVHVEQAYPIEHVATLMTDAGLAVEATYSCFGDSAPDAMTPRVFFVARKPGGHSDGAGGQR